jgi:hypothetical protein
VQRKEDCFTPHICQTNIWGKIEKKTQTEKVTVKMSFGSVLNIKKSSTATFKLLF